MMCLLLREKRILVNTVAHCEQRLKNIQANASNNVPLAASK